MTQQPLPPEDDLLGLESVDREIRIQRLRNEIEEVTGSEFVSGKIISDTSPDVEENFLEHVLALETHGFVRPFEQLQKDGFDLPPTETLDDAALTAKLWELIRELARYRLFLHSTDHLSDRELYAWLREEGLREEMMGFGLPFGNCFLDVIGSGSDEDTTIRMRYYADAEERAEWVALFPDFPMPEPEKAPYDRDRLLPKAEL